MHLKAVLVWGVCLLWGTLLRRVLSFCCCCGGGGGCVAWLLLHFLRVSHSLVFAVAEGVRCVFGGCSRGALFLLLLHVMFETSGRIAVTHSLAGSLAAWGALFCCTKASLTRIAATEATEEIWRHCWGFCKGTMSLCGGFWPCRLGVYSSRGNSVL